MAAQLQHIATIALGNVPAALLADASALGFALRPLVEGDAECGALHEPVAGVLLAIGDARDGAAAVAGEIDAVALHLRLELAGEQLGDLGPRERCSLGDAGEGESGGSNQGCRESGAKVHVMKPLGCGKPWPPWPLARFGSGARLAAPCGGNMGFRWLNFPLKRIKSGMQTTILVGYSDCSK